MPSAPRLLAAIALAGAALAANPKMQVSFLWHMHQPIYYPYETVTQTNAAGHFSFSVVDVHNQRLGPYTGWPRDAVQAGLSLPYLGAQVSFSGSLIENLNNLEAAGVNGGQWTNWKAGYRQAAGWLSTLGNRRLDLVVFGYHHPLMPLLDEQDIRMQLKLHKLIHGSTWNHSDFSKGLFPPEAAFATRIIPALVAEGVEWLMVDNIHFDRACVNYPHTNASNLFAPNRADQINPDPAASGGAWVQLNNLWAPSRVSAPFGYQPHQAQHVNSDTGQITKIVVVPAARYEGNEDGRGGYGAFLYDAVMDQYIAYNTDPARPMMVLLHHDGDNFGGGSDSYYHSNFQSMVNWVSGDPHYEVTTIADYLERYPVPAGDVIHVESGSWAGADNGDPEFRKWLGDPGANGWSPDQNSWAVLTAAKNRVFQAEALAPVTNLANILSGTGSNTAKAWRFLLCAQASDHWYWDGTEVWDSNVTRGCNQAVAFADPVIAGQPDSSPPTVFVPQRNPYNPGGFEWAAAPEPSEFEVWTFAYDVSGLQSVTLKWRVDVDGANPLASIQNETYAGGLEVGAWNSVAMSGASLPNPPANVLPATYRAQRFAATIAGQQDVLIDYYVEAADNNANITRTDIQHVWVGQPSVNPGGDTVVVTPDPPVAGQGVNIEYDPAGRPLAGAATVKAHVGFNDWASVLNPDVTMTWNAIDAVWTCNATVAANATQLDLAFNNGGGTWDNNGGADWHFTVSGTDPGPDWTMDGARDAASIEVAANGARHLWAGIDGDVLYVATEDAGEGSDVFIYVAASAPGMLRAANWAKAGQVADWGAFFADENNNDFESWFDATGARAAATGSNGGVIEGTLNLLEEFGALPQAICFAVGVYASADGGALLAGSQVPAGNGNGNIEAAEYVCVDLADIGGGAACVGDADGDSDVDLDDLLLVLGSFGAGSGGDVDGDSDTDLDDLLLVLGAFGSGC